MVDRATYWPHSFACVSRNTTTSSGVASTVGASGVLGMVLLLRAGDWFGRVKLVGLCPEQSSNHPRWCCPRLLSGVDRHEISDVAGWDRRRFVRRRGLCFEGGQYFSGVLRWFRHGWISNPPVTM